MRRPPRQSRMKNLYRSNRHLNYGDPMTIVVGIKCADGIVISTDTQSEFGRGVSVKRLNATKIYQINEKFAIAGAGMVAHIARAVNLIKLAMREAEEEGNKELSDVMIIDIMEKTLTAAHKRYNLDRARALDDEGELNFWRPILICGGICPCMDGKQDHFLSILHSAGLVEPTLDYCTIGSGAAYAEYVLKNYYYDGIKVSEAIPMAIYAIEEVKQIDPNCGGETRVGVIGDKYRELTRDEIQKITSDLVGVLDNVDKKLIPRILKGEIKRDDITKI